MKLKIRDFAKVSSGSTPLRSKHIEFFEGGKIPWVKTMDLTNGPIVQTDECITELAARSCKPYPPNTVLVAMYGGFNQIGRTGILQFEAAINQAISGIEVDPEICFPEYLIQYLNHYVYMWQRFAASSRKDPNITSADVRDFQVELPPLPEQKAIADLLSTWDEAIEKTERLIQAKEKIYAYSLTNLLNRNTKKRIRIGKFANEISKRNRELMFEQVLSVTNSRGFVLPEEQFERQVASSNLSNYKIVIKGQYAYNPSRINVGSIARLDSWDSGVLSPMYTVFQLDELKVNSDLFLHWLNSHEAREKIRRSAQGTVRETVSFDDFCSIGFPEISFSKQLELAEYFNSFYSEIDLLKQLAEKYKTQKRGLMQKMLKGEWRMKEEIIKQYCEA